MTTSHRVTVQITSMQKMHVEACVSIMGRLALFRKYKYTRTSARRMLVSALQDRRFQMIVAFYKDNVVGFAWFLPRGAFDRSGYLRLLAVDRQYQGRGVGTQLMRHLEKKYLRDGGIVLLSSSFNDDAQGFYKGLGYNRVGELPHYVQRGLNERIFFKPPPR